VGGAAARALLLQRQRALGGRVIVLDGGDLVQGTPYYNTFRGEPDHQLLDLLGYDAIALGNHDLDDGPAAWRARAAATRTPILSANVFALAESTWAAGADPVVPAAARRGAQRVGGGRVSDGVAVRYLARPYVVLKRDGLRIAVFGLTTPDLTHIVLPSRNRGVIVGSPIAAALELVPRLRSEADVVVALTHLGEADDRKLAERVPGIDIVIGGHSHTPLARPIMVRGPAGGVTVIAQAGSRGAYVGRTTLVSDDGRWERGQRRHGRGRLFPVRPDDGEDPTIEAFLARYRRELSRGLDVVVYRSPERVTSHGLRLGESPLGNFVADVIRDRTGAEIGMMNAGGIRAPLPRGDVTVGDVMSALPFDNRLVVVAMRGTQVRALLDRVARRIGKGGFAHFSGVRYVVRGDRAAEITIGAGPGDGGPGDGGAPLDGNRLYRVATIDFVAEGGDGIMVSGDFSPLEDSGVVLHDAASDYLRRHPEYRFGKDGRVGWRGATKALRGSRGR
jgi:2',3'-cyclic-nucleotide 2'-phosphodiesterase (5'-nucleotidase family)